MIVWYFDWICLLRRVKRVFLKINIKTSAYQNPKKKEKKNSANKY
jgi:hypothetical protein